MCKVFNYAKKITESINRYSEIIIFNMSSSEIEFTVIKSLENSTVQCPQEDWTGKDMNNGNNEE